MNEPVKAGANAVGHRNPVAATVTAIIDMFSTKGQLDPIGDDERIDGKTVFITGANTGLGKAIAIDLARRGGHILMACRSGHPDAGDDVRRISGSKSVEMLRVDLSDLDSVKSLCDSLVERSQNIEIAIFNAGLMPASSRSGPQGFELMFTVHFLSNRYMVERMMRDGLLHPSTDPARQPRIVFVSSEAHQSADPVDFDRLGEIVEYGMKDGLAEYGRTKLLLCTLAQDLSRRLNPSGEIGIAVHSLCPGPIASDIAREAPGWVKPALKPLMRLLFRSPENAAAPVVLLAAGKAMQGRNGVYLHMMREKQVSPLAADPESGERLWSESERLLKRSKLE